MTDDNVRYLMCYDDNGNMIAMCHFRFDTDEDVEVLYCYEIQLLKAARGKGLGKFLMQTLELMVICLFVCFSHFLPLKRIEELEGIH